MDIKGILNKMTGKDTENGAKKGKKLPNPLKMFSYNDIGIDLGTANTIVYKTGKGIVLREPSVIAIDTETHRPVACGNDAKEMIGRTPKNIDAIRPLREGVIADYESTALMLRYFLKKAMGKSFIGKKRILVCIPYEVTDVERRAVEEAASLTGAKDIKIIEEPLAAAIGAGLPVSEPTGSMIVDIGGGTTEVAVISLGGIVSSKSVRVAGDAIDAAIIAYVRKTYSLFIGERMAEEIKFEIGNATGYKASMEIRGRDMITGLPQNITITGDDICKAIEEPVALIVESVKNTLEHTPPELAADIIDHGIILSGGGAMLRGLDALISKETGIPVHIAKDPLDCVAIGTGRSLESPDLWNAISR